MKNKFRKHGCRFDPAEIMLLVLIFVLLGLGIFAMTEIGSLVWNAITNIRVTDPAESEGTAEGETLSAEAPAEGIGRKPAVTRYLGAPEAEEIGTAYALDEYTEGESPVPGWWNPDEEMSAVWYADVTDINVGDTNVLSKPHPPAGIDPGGVDWNLCSTIWGWDGHGAEVWEMDLFARVFYLEFWQPDMMLCEAGCDAILRLWESGEKGRTLGEVLSSRNEDGSWTYSVYPDIWTTDYDEDGLAWCRDYTAERFAEGPVWIAPYFRLDYYHDWAVPAYQIGNVYFSVGG